MVSKNHPGGFRSPALGVFLLGVQPSRACEAGESKRRPLLSGFLFGFMGSKEFWGDFFVWVPFILVVLTVF